MIQSLKIKIILIIFSAVTVFAVTSMVLETKTNTRLYRTQIEKEILANVKLSVSKIDQYTQAMEQKASDLARAGEVFYKIRKSTPNKNLDTEVSEYLTDNFSLFPSAIGGGIWYEPNKFYPTQKYYGPYAFWEKGKVVFTWDLTATKYDYLTQSWYALALPEDWDRKQRREHDYYWTPPYYDEAGTFLLMITVDAFMHDEDGSIIGITTADWSIADMLTFLKNSKITEDSEIFLVDGNSGIVMANSLDPQSVMASASSVSWISLLVSPQKNIIKTATIDVGGVAYSVHYTLTDAGMFYGTLVPLSIVSGTTDRLMMNSILRATLLALILIVILYFALSSVTNAIVALTNTVARVTKGDLTARAVATSRDELGLLGLGFNQMIETLSTQKQELESRATILEKKIEERTTKIEQQNLELTALKNNLETDLQKKFKELEMLKNNLETMVAERTNELANKLNEVEKLNKFMMNRELMMISLKKQIVELTNKLGGHADDSAPIV